MSANYDLTIEQGATFTFTLTVTGVNLTGYTARMQGRTSHAATATVFNLSSPSTGITVTPGTNSTVAVTLTAAQTALLTAPLEGVYDLEVASGALVDRLLEGTFRVTPEVTR